MNITSSWRRVFGAFVFAALAYGSSQAFAATPVGVGDPCRPRYGPDITSCYNACHEIYGDGVQFSCSTGYCQCIR